LPGLIIALIIGLAGGVSLGPEHPIMAVNIGLAVFLGSRILPRVGALDWTILASAGTIGALFGTPVAAALIFSQTLSSNNDVPLWDKLFAPLMAAAAGALTTSLFFHPHFSLSPPLRPDADRRYFQRCHRRRHRHCAGHGGGMVSSTPAPADA
jgi:H+/Cl- antiporter ClcA